jgi:hypothetical protein
MSGDLFGELLFRRYIKLLYYLTPLNQIQGYGGSFMKPLFQRKSKMILTFSAVLIFQCCCCIIPYSLSTNIENFSLTSPFERQEEEIRVPRRDSLNAEEKNRKILENLSLSFELDDSFASAGEQEPKALIIHGQNEKDIE